MIGFGIMNWKVTVISSNFIALMLILTMAMNIHMSTRFLQLRKEFPDLSIIKIINLTTERWFGPSSHCAYYHVRFYVVNFSEIKPIIDFGFMMSFGLLTSFVVTFTLLQLS